jgi:pyruvate/2-oxoglutarate dehydrogenase complex dihydrolipoamide dehydrogenase (E3) component
MVVTITPATFGVNVKDFGARGNGSTDDTAAFQAAINAARGGKLFIPQPSSFYKITDTLTITPVGADTQVFLDIEMLGKNGAILVDEDNQSSVPSIYAIGDVTDRVQLTPVAIREGQAFADTMYGNKPTRVDYTNIPSAVFSHPPIASVGMTEGEARDKLGTYKTYVSDFRPMKNVLAGRNERSLYKMIVDEETGQVVGIHMIGPDAPEILQAAAIAVKAGLTKAQFDDTIALHPTMSEELVLMR